MVGTDNNIQSTPSSKGARWGLLGGADGRAGSLCWASLMEVIGSRGATEGFKQGSGEVTVALTKGNAKW